MYGVIQSLNELVIPNVFMIILSIVGVVFYVIYKAKYNSRKEEEDGATKSLVGAA